MSVTNDVARFIADGTAGWSSATWEELCELSTLVIHVTRDADRKPNHCECEECPFWDRVPGEWFGCIPDLIHDVTGAWPVADSWQCPAYETELEEGPAR